jgi:putative transcriptional regulator
MKKHAAMLKYHPDARFLTDYAAGSLPASQALCVATHLHYCPLCRLKTGELTELGTELFMQLKPARVEQSEYLRLLDRLKELPAKQSVEKNEEQPASILPKAVHKLAGGNLEQLNWRYIGKNFRISNINVGDKQRDTSLFCIKAGGDVPHHRHKGDEITVILKGSFSDNEDKYEVGDFIVRTKGEAHKPVASQDQDCLCLSTLDAPIVMSNWLLRFGLYLYNLYTARHPETA